ncbi:hypothetical protein KC887_03090 [Candidatus Kaiserbacteria bacterium]|nr:hypothetical protein [Candidatus Kaiserbacteria bacterium]
MDEKLRTVVDYDIVQKFSIYELVIEVRKMVNEGWQPLGPAFMSQTSNCDLICQTMVKYEMRDAN